MIEHGPIHREVPREEVQEILSDSLFAPGHWGYNGLGSIQKAEVVDRRWFEAEVPISALVPVYSIPKLLDWIEDEEDEWGPFEYYSDPILVGPSWALPFANTAPAHPEYVILDGWHRVADLIRKGEGFIPAIIGVVDDNV